MNKRAFSTWPQTKTTLFTWSAYVYLPDESFVIVFFFSFLLLVSTEFVTRAMQRCRIDLRATITAFNSFAGQRCVKMWRGHNLSYFELHVELFKFGRNSFSRCFSLSLSLHFVIIASLSCVYPYFAIPWKCSAYMCTMYIKYDCLLYHRHSTANAKFLVRISLQLKNLKR